MTGLLSLSLHVFCPESRQKTLAQEWERVRLQWWKKVIYNSTYMYILMHNFSYLQYSHRNKGHFLVEKTDDRTRLIQVCKGSNNRNLSDYLFLQSILALSVNTQWKN